MLLLAQFIVGIGLQVRANNSAEGRVVTMRACQWSSVTEQLVQREQCLSTELHLFFSNTKTSFMESGVHYRWEKLNIRQEPDPDLFLSVVIAKKVAISEQIWI